MTRTLILNHRLTKHCIWIFAAASLNLTGCRSASERDYQRAQKKIEAGQIAEGLKGLSEIVRIYPNDPVSLTAAREGARVAFFENKDYLKSIEFNRHLAFHSTNPSEVLEAQRQIVQVYMEHLNDYDKSVLEIGRLMQIETDPTKITDLRIKLGRAHFHMKRFFQALAELQEAMKSQITTDQQFDLKHLKANVLAANKKFPEAVSLLKEIIAQDRTRAIKENVPITLAVCFEEMKEFRLAMQTLEDIKNDHPIPEYVDLRIKRLNDRLENQPRSLRK